VRHRVSETKYRDSHVADEFTGQKPSVNPVQLTGDMTALHTTGCLLQ